MADKGKIVIRGAKVNNLKNISLEIPRGKFVVITGISGSGKSSLAFDTLFAEGQRRFAESLSSYARQFLGRMSKPDVEMIEGIPPAIAIEQKVNTRNPRSTVATTTEIFDYIRIVFARIGRTYSPISGREVVKDSVNDVLDYIFESKVGAAYVLVDVGWDAREDKVELMLDLKQEGFARFMELPSAAVSAVDAGSAADAGLDDSACGAAKKGKTWRIEEVMQMATEDYPKGLVLMVDRLRLPAGEPDEDMLTRVRDSVNTAFNRGDGRILIYKENGDDITVKGFSNRFEADGMTFQEPDEYLFSFNSPLGACPECGGLGKIVGISEDLVVPDKSKNVYEGAIACWRGEKMGWFRNQAVLNAEKYGLRIFEPYCNLTEEEKDILWNGRKAETEEESIIGINDFFKWVSSNRYKIQFKYMLGRYSGKTVCRACGGSRLRKEAMYVKVGGKTIHQLLSMNAGDLIDFFENVELNDYEREIAGGAIDEILSRLHYIKDVGLSYLTLNRASNTLSGGESQRINLVTALGSSLVGSLYILDEPSIGLHPRDTERLIYVLKKLRDIGNTVVVVEHDEEIMRAADLLVDIGPKAGVHGGEIVYEGNLASVGSVMDGSVDKAVDKSLTLQYLTGKRTRYIRKKRPWKNSIVIEGAMEHNLKDINVRFPLGVLTVVTGVSGSGKSSLVGDVLYPALYRYINEAGPVPGVFRGLSGDLDKITQIEYVDQNPIGKSLRSNAITYLKIYDDIRKLLSDQPFAKMNGFIPSHFSFNQEGGRCPECQGEGFVKIEMQFMADVKMVCEACGGKRFKPEILEVRYKEKNVDDILNMTVEEAIEFFNAQPEPLAKKIAAELQPLVDVGLTYIKLGQSSSTLSGGESQRVKLASFLSIDNDSSRRKKQHVLFIFDEPTTGLHFYDVEKLLKSFDALLAKGHSIIVVEHNPDVIRSADWVIDLGPEAGDGGGNVVFSGTPEDLMSCEASYTAHYIK